MKKPSPSEQEIQDAICDLVDVVVAIYEGENPKEILPWGQYVLNSLKNTANTDIIEYAEYCLTELSESKNEVEVFLLLNEFQNCISRICLSLGLPPFM